MHSSLGIWPFGGSTVSKAASAKKCWDDALGDQLIAACKNEGGLCSPANVAHLLSLPYCPGVCPGADLEKKASTPASVWMLGIGVVAIAGVLALRRRRR